MTVSSSPGAEVAPRQRVLPRRPLAAAIGMTIFLAILWAIEFVDQTFVTPASPDPLGLDAYGIVPREVDGLSGILFAPLLHGDYQHLASNSLPFLILGFLVLAGGLGQFLAVTAVIWLGSGFATWLTGGGITVGASGIIFGWLAYLLVRGFFNRSARQIVLALVLFVVYGGLLWGVLPTQAGVSWQAHLFGALFGIVAARLTVAADRSRAAP